MPCAIALGTPFLVDYEGEPMILCEYAILPTGSMLQADQLLYGEIGALATLAPRLPAAMVVPAGAIPVLFPKNEADVPRTNTFARHLALEFEQHLIKLQMLEDLTAMG